MKQITFVALINNNLWSSFFENKFLPERKKGARILTGVRKMRTVREKEKEREVNDKDREQYTHL